MKNVRIVSWQTMQKLVQKRRTELATITGFMKNDKFRSISVLIKFLNSMILPSKSGGFLELVAQHAKS